MALRKLRNYLYELHIDISFDVGREQIPFHPSFLLKSSWNMHCSATAISSVVTCTPSNPAALGKPHLAIASLTCRSDTPFLIHLVNSSGAGWKGFAQPVIANKEKHNIYMFNHYLPLFILKILFTFSGLLSCPPQYPRHR